MSLQEIENKFLLIQNYKVKLSNTFTKIANKYMVAKIVDNIAKKNFYYTDYLQDLKKENHAFVKLERKRISANNIIKISCLVEPQEPQSPIPEIFTNKVNIGEKKLRKEEKKISFRSNQNNNKKSSCKRLEFDNEYDDDKEERKKTNNINDDESSSMNSLTLELIQKKANFFSASVNKRNKKELKRRKIQFEAIRKLRHFCFQKLKNKRFIAKSSHRNVGVLCIKKNLNDEDEKNNSNCTNKNNNKDKNKTKKLNNSKLCKKKVEILNSSKKKNLPKKKKKANNNNNTGIRRQFRNNSTKKSPAKAKRAQNQRNSLVEKNNLISGKLEKDILRFKKNIKKKEKEKDKDKDVILLNQFTPKEEDILKKYSKFDNININSISHGQYKKQISTALRESYNLKNNHNNQIMKSNQVRTKGKYITFIEFRKPTKKNYSTCNSNFFNKRNMTNKNLYSSKNLVNVIKKYRTIKGTKSKSDRKRRYSIPNHRRNNTNDQKSIFINNFDLKNDNKDKKGYNNLYNNENQIWNIGKIEINNIYKVSEEDS
jgi:hypothetical protein